MSDEKKWDDVEKLMRRPQEAIAPAPAPTSGRPLAVIEEQIESVRSKELDLIGRFKRNKITREAALEGLKAMHDSQLEAAKHALRRAVDVDRARVDAVANKYIFQINEEFLQYLKKLGIQNFESRMDTLLELNTTMARLLERAKVQDVPPSVRDSTIQTIITKYNEFSKRIVDEELKLSK